MAPTSGIILYSRKAWNCQEIEPTDLHEGPARSSGRGSVEQQMKSRTESLAASLIQQNLEDIKGLLETLSGDSFKEDLLKVSSDEAFGKLTHRARAVLGDLVRYPFMHGEYDEHVLAAFAGRKPRRYDHPLWLEDPLKAAVCETYHCVYQASCAVSGKAYIGYTNNIAARRLSHLQNAKLGGNGIFAEAIREHGEDAFEWTVLAVTKYEEVGRAIEGLLIKELGTLHPGGYNAVGSADMECERKSRAGYFEEKSVVSSQSEKPRWT